MAEKKPYINARLRNPVEEAAAKKSGGNSPVDWIGGACAIVAFCLAAATLVTLYLEWDLYTKFIAG